MLHFLTTILTTVATLAHAVMGCCWHHGHEETAPKNEAAVSTCSCPHHPPGLYEAPPADHSDPDHHDGCCRGTCTALKPGDIDRDQPPPADADVSQPCVPVNAEQFISIACCSARDASPPALPVRAALSVWLL